jgi:hypothetical protein
MDRQQLRDTFNANADFAVVQSGSLVTHNLV